MKKHRGLTHGFTLVELLVVIGIIALLVGILLPALSAARRQAAAVKCAASLREIGNAFFMYAQENKGYAPPAKLTVVQNGSAPNYSLYGYDFTFPSSGATPPFWFNFLSKYVTKSKVGYAAGGSGGDAADATKSIFWACPAWEGYQNSVTAGSTNAVQPGYGMNAFPEYTAQFPGKKLELGEKSGFDTTYTNVNLDPLVAVPVYSGPGWSNFTCKWYKLKQFTLASDRALAGDSLFWLLEARPPSTPPQMAGQYTLANQSTWSGGSSPSGDGLHETTFDMYRHGKYPPRATGGNGDTFDSKGGKVSFNVLFADGHVATLTDPTLAYKVVRMRYPN